MPTWIGLLRGINVGGRHRLPMPELVRCLGALGCSGARTYIQSGNVVFDSPRTGRAALAADVAAAVEAARGFRPEVVLLTRAELSGAIEANPFPEATAAPATLHVFFLARPTRDANLAALESHAAASERFRLVGSAFYLHAPDGLGRSKLAQVVERHLGVPATARNWRTVEKLRQLAE